MSFGRFRRDPCGIIPAPERACPRCCRMYGTLALELTYEHKCPACIERQARLRDAAKERAS